MSDSPSPKPRKLLDQIRDAIRLKHFYTSVINCGPNAVRSPLD